MTATRRRTTRTTRKKDWAPDFLKALAEHPDVSRAAAAVGIQRSTAYRRRLADEDFAVAWADALDKSLDQLEAALFKRAIDTDTTAAIFLLKSHRPQTYRENVKVEHTGHMAQETVVTFTPPAEWRGQMVQLARQAGALPDDE
jgi:hypothetical protein